MSRYSFYGNRAGLSSSDKINLSSNKLDIKILKDAIILPARQDVNGVSMWALGGVVDNSGKFVEESAFPRGVFGGLYDFDEREVNYVDEEVVFLGPFVFHWGHFLCDLVSRLWWVIENPSKYKIAYCGWYHGRPPTEMKDNYLEFFNLLGIKKSQLIDVQTLTRYKKVIIPDVSMSICDKFFTREFQNIFKVLVINAKGKYKGEIPKKVYLTREQFPDAREKEYGEHKISKFFSQNGYEVFSPESLSLFKQIAFFQNCKNIAAVSGTITHNMLFAGKNLELIVINKLDLVNNYQAIIDSMNENRVVNIDAYMRIFPVLFGKGPFIFETNKYLRRFAKDYEYLDPKSDTILERFRKYRWYLKKYYKIYKDPSWREMLGNQQKAMKKKKNKFSQ